MPNNKGEKAKKKRRRSTKGSSDSSESRDATMAASNPSTTSNPAASPAMYPGFVPGTNTFPYPRVTDYPSPNPMFMHPQNTLPVDLTSKLDFILSKVSKLDVIESQQNEIVKRLNSIDAELRENKRLIDTAHRKIADVEESQNLLSGKFESVSKQSASNKSLLDKMETELKSVSEKNVQLEQDNSSLEEDIVDLQCRSMRDNLVFLGIPETTRPLQRTDAMEAASSTPSTDNVTYSQAASPEDCVSKIYEFCENVLKIDNSRDNIRIDRAHRMGAGGASRTRPIVVKFMDTDSKMRVKSTLKGANLKNSPYNVFDQLPQKVQERRKSLIPIMLKARSEGKRAYLVRDKLFINNSQYRPGSD